ncbi:hypothetical protein D3C75_227970 [compost metagenome]
MAVIDLFDLPQLAGKREAITRRRHSGNGTDLLGSVIYNMLFIILEHCVETEVIDDLLTGQADQHRALIHPLDMTHRNHIVHKSIIIRRINPAEGRQC